jgi:hypothetical protein
MLDLFYLLDNSTIRCLITAVLILKILRPGNEMQWYWCWSDLAFSSSTLIEDFALGLWFSDKR